MAAATTTGNIIRESLGSLTFFVQEFSDIDDAQTYDSGLTDVVCWWWMGTDQATTQEYGMSITHSAGVFTFLADEDSRTGFLYILARA